MINIIRNVNPKAIGTILISMVVGYPMFSSEVSKQDDLYVQAYVWHRGLSEVKNLDKAITLYEQAANLGDIKSCVALVYVYKDGELGEVDLERAFYWRKKAAEHGDVVSAYLTALNYREGIGVAQDLMLAITWAQKAVDSGDVQGVELLASIYFLVMSLLGILRVPVSGL